MSMRWAFCLVAVALVAVLAGPGLAVHAQDCSGGFSGYVSYEQITQAADSSLNCSSPSYSLYTSGYSANCSSPYQQSSVGYAVSYPAYSTPAYSTVVRVRPRASYVYYGYPVSYSSYVPYSYSYSPAYSYSPYSRGSVCFNGVCY